MNVTSDIFEHQQTNMLEYHDKTFLGGRKNGDPDGNDLLCQMEAKALRINGFFNLFWSYKVVSNFVGNLGLLLEDKYLAKEL